MDMARIKTAPASICDYLMRGFLVERLSFVSNK